MTEMLLEQGSSPEMAPWGERMLAPDEVAAMVRLHKLGWGTKRIAEDLGCSRNTVKRYLAAGGWAAIRQPQRKRASRGARGVVGRALSPASRQLRCGAPGPGA